MTQDEPDECTTPFKSAERGPSKVPEDKPRDKPLDKDDEQATLGLFTLAGLGLSIAVCVAGGVGLGIYLDDTTHRSPLFTLVGLALGVAVAVGVAYLEIKRFL